MEDDDDILQSLLNEANRNNDEVDVEITSAQLIQMLEEIWVNEKFAPEILPHKEEIVSCVIEQLSFMEKNITTLTSQDFMKGIYQLEVDRIRFLMSSYLRQRLLKIETYVFQILKEEEERGEEGCYLTQAETNYANKYKRALEQHFENVTSFCPGLPFEEWKNHPVKPNLNSFLFLRAKNQIQNIAVGFGGDDSEVVDVVEGSQMLVSYSSIANLLKNGDVKLI